MDSSTLAKNLHKALKEMGHEMSLGHVYEAIAKTAGHKSWNVAKTDEQSVAETLRVLTATVNVSLGLSPIFDVKVVVDTEDGSFEMKKYYRVHANSIEEAEEGVAEYVKFRKDEAEELDNKIGIQIAEIESEESFKFENWEVIYLDFDNTMGANVESVTEIPIVQKKTKLVKDHSRAIGGESEALKKVQELEKMLMKMANRIEDEDEEGSLCDEAYRIIGSKTT